MRAVTTCMTSPTSIDVDTLIKTAKGYESQKKIGKNNFFLNHFKDSLSNVLKHKNFIFHGKIDSVVRLPASSKLNEFYEKLGLKVATNFDINAEHAMITDDFGGSCSKKGTPWINNCGFSLAGQVLQNFYGKLNAPVAAIEKNVKKEKKN
jgi:predicted lactoylglutathione lyase